MDPLQLIELYQNVFNMKYKKEKLLSDNPIWIFLTRLSEIISRNDINHDLIAQISDTRIKRLDQNGYSPIIWIITNLSLIKGIYSPGLTNQEKWYIQNHIRGLDTLFNLVPEIPIDMTVFRGDKYLQYRENTIHYRQYIHTSLNIDAIMEGGYIDIRDPILVITIPKGSKVLYHPSESQIILPRNSSLSIESIRKERWYICKEYTERISIYCKYIG